MPMLLPLLQPPSSDYSAAAPEATLLTLSCFSLAYRFVMGSTKVLAVALGKGEADELRPNLSQLSARLKGMVSMQMLGAVTHCSFKPWEANIYFPAMVAVVSPTSCTLCVLRVCCCVRV